MAKNKSVDIRLGDRFGEVERSLRVYVETGDHMEVLRQVVEWLPEAFQVERCSIFFQDTINKRAMLQCGTDLVTRELSCPMEGTVVGEVLTSGEMRKVDHVDANAALQRELREMTSFETQSILCVPIFAPGGKKTLGALQLLNKTGRRSFGEEDGVVLQQVAAHLAVPVREMVEDYEELAKAGRKKDVKRLMAEFFAKWFPQWLPREE